MPRLKRDQDLARFAERAAESTMKHVDAWQTQYNLANALLLPFWRYQVHAYDGVTVFFDNLPDEKSPLAADFQVIGPIARITRASANAVWSREFVLAARACGKGAVRITLEHVLPNIASVLIVQATIRFAIAILAEAALSYLGLGTQPPQPVPALVSAFSAATVWQPLLMAEISIPLVTSKQEQICALSGSLSTPIDGLPLPAWAGRISESGFSGSSMALSTSCSRLP